MDTLKNIPLTNRHGRRVGVSIPATFFVEDGFEGEALVHDLSTSGCRLSSPVALSTGLVIRLSLFLPDCHPWPAVIEEAMIRWVASQECGVRFLDFRLAVRERLRAVTMKAKALPHPPQHGP